MKDLNDLLQQFDDIQELPVSEETVGAYIEGRLDDVELADFKESIQHDESLLNIVENASAETPTFDAEDFFSDDVIDFDKLPIISYEELSDSQYEQDNSNYTNEFDTPADDDTIETPEGYIVDEEGSLDETNEDYDSINYTNLEY